MASACGADRVINVANDTDALAQYKENKGYFDLIFECSGNAQAMAEGIAAIRPLGIVMQIGLGGDMPVPMMQITAKEIDLRGSFRFHPEFKLAIELMSNGLIDVKPLITHTFALGDAESAFQLANDRNKAMKVQIEFNS